MYIVMTKKSFRQQFAALGQMWSHTTPETAIKHACDRSRFDNEPYVVINSGLVVFTTE